MIKRIVGFSGGVDSQATALLVRRQFPPEEIILLNSDAGGNEHPITEAFIRRYSETVFPVTTVRALVRDLEGRGTREGRTKDRRDEFSDDDILTFERLAYIKDRFPSKKIQFCTHHLKLVPQKRWIQQNIIAPDPTITIERYIGVRSDESSGRANLPAHEWDDVFDCDLYRPVLTWTKQQCFDYVREAGEEVNPLYTMGFNRVGCAPCINSGKDDIREWAARFPEMIDKVRGWEKSVGRTFFAPCVPGKEINWIDEVVEWSRTARGGKQSLLAFTEADADAGQCVSKYGLCE